jgi:hypothetical protein
MVTKAQQSSPSLLQLAPLPSSHTPGRLKKIEEFIAAGDSYTAGPGCNGNDETFAGDAVRGKRSYPVQMPTDADNWEFINRDKTLPRFSFPAYTGDTTVELLTEQLTRGDFKENNQNLALSHSESPSLLWYRLVGMMPISPSKCSKRFFETLSRGCADDGGNSILNNCIYRAWFPGDCQDTLTNLQKEIDDGSLREKINYALYQVAHAGRESGGADPREAFQVYVPGYIQFFNEVETACDQFS